MTRDRPDPALLQIAQFLTDKLGGWRNLVRMLANVPMVLGGGTD